MSHRQCSRDRRRDRHAHGRRHRRSNGRAALLAAALLYALTPAAAETASGDRKLTGMELFDDTFGPATSSCELGFLAVGSPLVVTRTSAWADEGGVRESDRILAADGRPVNDGAALRDALGLQAERAAVDLSVQRGGQTFDITVHCRDASEILRARKLALQSALRNEWNDCIRATYVEEMLWGGPNSQSAGLRLWCHQARQGIDAGATDLKPLDAQLLFEYAERLIVELRYTDGDTTELRSRLDFQSKRIADSGHADLASTLNELMVASAP